jgi:hypothetical protein
MLKQSSLTGPRTGTAELDSRKTNITFSTQSNVKSSTIKNTEVRASIKNASKRRANSNNAADKKVNLDKFLSAVQQRSNFTPSSHVNGIIAMQGITHLYKPNTDDKMSYNSTNLTMN